MNWRRRKRQRLRLRRRRIQRFSLRRRRKNRKRRRKLLKSRKRSRRLKKKQNCGIILILGRGLPRDHRCSDEAWRMNYYK